MIRKLEMNTKLNRLGYISLMALGAVAVCLLWPAQLSSAEAALPELTEGQSQAGAQIETSLDVEPVISIALSNRMDLTVVPTSQGGFAQSTATLMVATNNPSGYSLFMGTLDKTQDLHIANPESESKIGPIVGMVTAETFQKDTWGYNLVGAGEMATNPLIYQAVPGESQQVEADTTKNHFDLNIGVAASGQLEKGTYSNTVVVTAVANPRTITTLNDAAYMQEMNTTVCEKTTVGTTKRLVDSRDGKRYWVAKLADNNCWMTQNLALDLSTDTPLTPADSDVTANWTPGNTTETAIPSDGVVSYTGTRSWNMGDYALVTPVQGVSCGVLVGDQTPAECTDLYATRGLEPTGVVKNGTWGDYQGLITIDVAQEKYDAHYLLGNYYQWNAATAGSGGAMVGGEAPNSVCPKNWRIPSTTIWETLVTQYGIKNTPVGSEVNGKTYNVALEPLYLVRAGEVSVSAKSFGWAGSNGSIWSSVASPHDSKYVYITYFSSSEFSTVGYPSRYGGFNIRCVVR